MSTAAAGSGRLGRSARAGLPWATLAVAAAALLAHWIEPLLGLLELRPADLRGGALHGLWTGHLVHFGSAHLTWDLAMFLALGVVAERLDARATRRLLLLGAPVIGLAVALFDSELRAYRGLSGVATGLFAFVALHLASEGPRSGRRALGRWALVGLALKVVYELVQPTPLFVDAQGAFRSVPIAHLTGALCGLAAARCHGPARGPGAAPSCLRRQPAPRCGCSAD